jgi:hypothetical protein
MVFLFYMIVSCFTQYFCTVMDNVINVETGFKSVNILLCNELVLVVYLSTHIYLQLHVLCMCLQRRELDEPEVIVCELCQQETTSFNRHMRYQHPGCGGKVKLNYTLCIKFKGPIARVLSPCFTPYIVRARYDYPHMMWYVTMKVNVN